MDAMQLKYEQIQQKKETEGRTRQAVPRKEAVLERWEIELSRRENKILP